MNNQPQQQQIQIRASDADLKGIYSNMAMISHTQEEFVMDFLNIANNMGILSSRVILSPGHFKRLVNALQDNLKKYEGQFGNVTPAEEQSKGIGFKV